MKTTKFQRITALVLAVLCVFGGFTIATSAAAPAESEESSLANIKELLNAISYNEYEQLEEYVKAGVASSPVTVIGTDGVYVNGAGDEVSANDNTYVVSGNKDNDAKANEKFDISRPGIFDDKTANKVGLFIPDTGKVTWEVKDITTPAKYNMYIEYYPFNNKSADVERIFLINGEVPFAEARYISMSKYWSTPYPEARLQITSKMDGEAILAEA